MEKKDFSPKKRETYTTFEYEGRTFRINAYDPMTGNYILMMIATMVLPFALGESVKEAIPSSEKVLNNAAKNGRMMSKAEFIALQTDILSTVEEVYTSGNTSPVVRENGTYGTEDVTVNLCLKLLIASLAFNYRDFFGELPSVDTIIKA